MEIRTGALPGGRVLVKIGFVEMQLPLDEAQKLYESLGRTLEYIRTGKIIMEREG